MNRPFRPEPEASAELEEAALWYESQRPGLGTEFLEAVDAALDRIARWPQAAPRVPGVAADVPARKAPVSNFPYHIAYLEMPDAISILAFAHDRREPGYWHSRVKKP
jgi:plasmid stabilization system protein ParE